MVPLVLNKVTERLKRWPERLVKTITHVIKTKDLTLLEFLFVMSHRTFRLVRTSSVVQVTLTIL